MPARNSWPVRRLWDTEADPPRQYEAVTGTAHALAFWVGGTWSDPSHREGSALTGSWWCIPHHAPADAQPELITYDRSEGSRPFAVGAERYAQLGDAMEGAVGGPRIAEAEEFLAHQLEHAVDDEHETRARAIGAALTELEQVRAAYGHPAREEVEQP